MFVHVICRIFLSFCASFLWPWAVLVFGRCRLLRDYTVGLSFRTRRCEPAIAECRLRAQMVYIYVKTCEASHLTRIPAVSTCSMLTGVPPFEIALPSQDRRCQVVAEEENLVDLLSAWGVCLSPEVSDVEV